jgi:hypothetical protein
VLAVVAVRLLVLVPLLLLVSLQLLALAVMLPEMLIVLLKWPV